jgi:hypothetical protein
MNNTLKSALVGFVMSLFPLLASAQTPQKPPVFFNSIGDFQTRLCDIAYWIYTFIIIIGVIYVLYASFKYMSSGGDSNQVSEASHTLVYTAVGLVVAMVAFGIPGLTAGLIGATGFSFAAFCAP